MMLLPLVALLLFLPGCPGLPFYNGFYYGNVMNDRGYSNGNGPGEGLFNGVKLVVETPEEALFSHRGANVTLPCHYHYEPALGSPRPVRVKWWKLGEGGEPERDVLVAIGLRHRSFGEFRGRVHLQQENGRDVSLVIRDLRLRDYGRYRCEVIDGLEDESGVVDLELRGVVFPYQPRLGRYQLNFHEAQRACEGQDAAVASFEQLFRAWEEGLDWCNAGWLLDGTVQYPITQPRQPCGGHGTAPGVRSYGQRHRSRHRYDVFCFSAAQRGRVYYLEHPEKLTLAEAEAACLEDGARIAKFLKAKEETTSSLNLHPEPVSSSGPLLSRRGWGLGRRDLLYAPVLTPRRAIIQKNPRTGSFYGNPDPSPRPPPPSGLFLTSSPGTPPCSLHPELGWLSLGPRWRHQRGEALADRGISPYPTPTSGTSLESPVLSLIRFFVFHLSDSPFSSPLPCLQAFFKWHLFSAY
ncbi:hyaluronan and proteoglycan link protein 3 isoform X1 [Ornithorhynchus anatinus]|uniref:hyaluronan and proteoglycan link protein 3 isoform X1 n=1 Tax=Ornithorhynchus anatinus TaxID=9258 RepID=UPI0010A890DC|nr:hyaluronan and proteoglycan link protein 3 isoform X1 [Ornithorhynchus anatinus]